MLFVQLLSLTHLFSTFFTKDLLGKALQCHLRWQWWIFLPKLVQSKIRSSDTANRNVYDWQVADGTTGYTLNALTVFCFVMVTVSCKFEFCFWYWHWKLELKISFEVYVYEPPLFPPRLSICFRHTKSADKCQINSKKNNSCICKFNRKLDYIYLYQYTIELIVLVQ